VTLKVGDNIPIFKGVKEAEEKQQAIQEKFTKAIEKKAKKETKPTRGGLRRFVNRRGEV
jgi:GMP synthase PP-ATPase subunit